MVPDDRLRQALSVFLQYGYRKTSMDDVARGIGISRQALYKQFKSKQHLFEAVVAHVADTALLEASRALHCKNTRLQDRLLEALDRWAGQFIDELRSSPHSSEVILMASCEDVAEQRHENFCTLLKETFEDEGVKPPHGGIDDMVTTLSYATKGMIHTAQNRDEFLTGARQAIRVMIG